ncbi:MAG: hypothetical protein AAGG68_13970 [Bacteroidota bacterium]
MTTLAENRYFLGMAALLNSIVKHGTYFDHIVVGYRGNLPSWLTPLKESKYGKAYAINEQLSIELIAMDGSLHMVHEKPKWFHHLCHELYPEADEYFFFDADIVVMNRMSFFGEWVQHGVALCEDINYYMALNHPIRLHWKKAAAAKGIAVKNQLYRYYNSGFLGWKQEHKAFLGDWEKCFAVLAEYSGDMTKFRTLDRTYPVLSTNQDSLNLATMITSVPMSAIGPEAMSFQHGLNLMVHPLGLKPWDKKFLLDFFKGYPPRATDFIFWQNVNGQVFAPFSEWTVRWKVFTCKILRFFARFYERLDM